MQIPTNVLWLTAISLILTGTILASFAKTEDGENAETSSVIKTALVFGGFILFAECVFLWANEWGRKHGKKVDYELIQTWA